VEPLFVSGPSGVGKSFLTQYLVDHYNCKKIVTTTTRPPRLGETNGVNYHFVSQGDYDFLERTGQLCISDRLLGACYGLRKGEVESICALGKTPICEAYAPHISLFTHAFPNSRAIFLIPENYDLLVKRMRMRGDPEEKIAVRLEMARTEMDLFRASVHVYYNKCYTIQVGNFEQVTQDIRQTFLQS
jgi:guanylate kinase